MQEFDGPYLRVEGIEKPLLNMANFDFLGMGQRKELKEAAVMALNKVQYAHGVLGESYGVGENADLLYCMIPGCK